MQHTNHTQELHGKKEVEIVAFLTQRSKVPPLLHQSMEEGETEQEFLPDDLFLGAAEEVRISNGVTQVRAQQIGSDSFGRLIGHLQSILQDADRELVRWVACQPQSEEESMNMH